MECYTVISFVEFVQFVHYIYIISFVSFFPNDTQVSFQLWKDKEEVLRKNNLLQKNTSIYVVVACPLAEEMELEAWIGCISTSILGRQT